MGVLANLGYSMYGGALMVVVGILYLAFERKLLARSKMAGDSIAPANDFLSRSLIGAQVKMPHNRHGVRTLTISIDRIDHPSNVCYEIYCVVFTGKNGTSSRQSNSWLVLNG